MGRPRIEKTKFIALYLTNISEYELLDDASFGKVVKAVMRMKNSGDETELSELEQYIYNKLLRQVNEDEKRYLEKKEEDRKRKSSIVAHQSTQDKETISSNTKVSQIEEKRPLIGVGDTQARAQNEPLKKYTDLSDAELSKLEKEILPFTTYRSGDDIFIEPDIEVAISQLKQSGTKQICEKYNMTVGGIIEYINYWYNKNYYRRSTNGRTA